MTDLCVFTGSSSTITDENDCRRIADCEKLERVAVGLRVGKCSLMSRCIVVASTEQFGPNLNFNCWR